MNFKGGDYLITIKKIRWYHKFKKQLKPVILLGQIHVAVKLDKKGKIFIDTIASIQSIKTKVIPTLED